MMKEPEYPLLKIKCHSVNPCHATVELDGKPIPYLRGIKFQMHVENDVNIVQLEILAKVEIESLVEILDEGNE